MPTTQKRAHEGATTTKRTTSRRSGKSAGSQKRTGNGHSSSHMVENLEEGFLVELADMLYAERELQKILPKLAQAANSRRLRDALEWQAEQTEEQAMRLESVFKLFGHEPEAETCEGMQGILAECKEQLQKTGQGPVRDAMIIGAVQKAKHYEIAAYGTLCSWADQLGAGRAVRILEESLHEERATDRNLTRIAETLANPEAEYGNRRGYDDERRPRAMRDEYEERSTGRSGRNRRYED